MSDPVSKITLYQIEKNKGIPEEESDDEINFDADMSWVSEFYGMEE